MDHQPPPPPPPPQPPPLPPPSYTCTNWCYSKAAGCEPTSQEPSKTSTSSFPTQTFSKLVDGVASWLASAFFTSLERFSCIVIDTKDDKDDSDSYFPLVGSDDDGQVPPRDVGVQIIDVFEAGRNSESYAGQEVHGTI